MDFQDRVVRLYEEARADVYHYILRLGLAPAQAQEMTQESFLRLHAALVKGEEIENPRGWVFRVAHNLALTGRATRGRWAPLDDAAAGALADPSAGPELQAIGREREARVSEAVAELSEQQRRCLYLRAEGMRYREIAETIGIGISSVGETLARAVARLRRAIDE